MEVYNNNKGSVASKAVVSYMDRVKEYMDPKAIDVTAFLGSDKRDVKALVDKLHPTDKKKLPKGFLDDVSSMRDLVTKVATSDLDPYVSRKIRELAESSRLEANALLAKTSRRRGLMTSADKAASKRMQKGFEAQQQPFLEYSADPSTNLAWRVRMAMRGYQQAQKAPLVSLETEPAAITPEAATKAV